MIATLMLILDVLRAAYRRSGGTLGWPLAVETVRYLDRYSSTGRHRLRVGYECVAGRPLTAQAMNPVPRALLWA